MIPAKHLRPARLGSLRGPSILKGVTKYEADILVGWLAGGENAACFLSGPHEGNGFTYDNNTAWTGLAVEGVEFEVDLDSAYDASTSSGRSGALIRKGDRLETLTRMRFEGFSEGRRVILVSDLPPADNERETGFTRWRAIIRDGEHAYEVYSFDAAADAPPA